MNFYPRPPRGGRLENAETSNDDKAISIHALREEGDSSWLLQSSAYHISIHALREEGDRNKYSQLPPQYLFLSTPSARRATCRRRRKNPDFAISIHALREEGDDLTKARWYLDYNFYPRPPRGGRLPALLRDVAAPTDFYPRPPRGGRPERLHSTAFDRTISIHALREEGDAQKQLDATAKGLFLSTPSARRATAKTEKNISAFVSL